MQLAEGIADDKQPLEDYRRSDVVNTKDVIQETHSTYRNAVIIVVISIGLIVSLIGLGYSLLHRRN